ncbi:HNH endonuclease signature motif containing protein [Citrobacter farmeri]|uniref:HNH endonuclease signature motif containing protein n=1 Tax=Citrobacter farmeri TaxID=67824 RepID=UPI002A80820B|nr:HNH endonuclease signature motif containing protein [Citrobacter farmeri]
MSNYSDTFEYEPLTGSLRWLKATSQSIKVGSYVGWMNFCGYLVTTVRGKRIGVHRIIWEMHHGEIPTGYEVDHINHVKHDNRIEPEKGMGDWRFMISEPGIVNVEDLPSGWGLLHVIKGRVKKVHGWPGNGLWVNRDSKPFQANKQAECDYMYSALRRMDLRGHLKEVYDGVIVNKTEGTAA